MSVATASEDGAPRPVCRLSGADGNVFNVIALVRKALRGAGQNARASEFVRRAFAALSYDEVLELCHEYVDVR